MKIQAKGAGQGSPQGTAATFRGGATVAAKLPSPLALPFPLSERLELAAQCTSMYVWMYVRTYIPLCYMSRVHATWFKHVCVSADEYVFVRKREVESTLLPPPPHPSRSCCCSCVGFRGHRSRYPPPASRASDSRIILKRFTGSHFGDSRGILTLFVDSILFHRNSQLLSSLSSTFSLTVAEIVACFSFGNFHSSGWEWKASIWDSSEMVAYTMLWYESYNWYMYIVFYWFYFLRWREPH